MQTLILNLQTTVSEITFISLSRRGVARCPALPVPRLTLSPLPAVLRRERAAHSHPLGHAQHRRLLPLLQPGRWDGLRLRGGGPRLLAPGGHREQPGDPQGNQHLHLTPFIYLIFLILCVGCRTVAELFFFFFSPLLKLPSAKCRV